MLAVGNACYRSVHVYMYMYTSVIGARQGNYACTNRLSKYILHVHVHTCISICEIIQVHVNSVISTSMYIC